MSVDLKVVVLGQSGVGKTCLSDRYLNGKYRNITSPTVGAAFGASRVRVGERELSVGLWDTAGAERFEAMSRQYYRYARAACVCFDLTRAETWPKVKFWVNELISFEKDCALYIVGTKADLLEHTPRAVDESVVNEFARQVNAQVFDTSAMTGTGVDDLFETIVSDFVQNAAGKETLGKTGHIAVKPSDGACSC
jgi:Ras-related protein Rab-24